MSEGSGIRQKVSALKQLELEERGEQSTAQPSSVPGDRSERDCTSVGELPMTLRISDGQYQKDCAILVPAALRSRQCTGRMSAGQQPRTFGTGIGTGRSADKTTNLRARASLHDPDNEPLLRWRSLNGCYALFGS